jgi:hypothetical protein
MPQIFSPAAQHELRYPPVIYTLTPRLKIAAIACQFHLPKCLRIPQRTTTCCACSWIASSSCETTSFPGLSGFARFFTSTLSSTTFCRGFGMSFLVILANHLLELSTRPIYGEDDEAVLINPALLNARVPPDELEEYRRCHTLRLPCCLCAYIDEVAYTETQTMILEKHGSKTGRYAAVCARGRCGYRGTRCGTSICSTAD